MKTIEQELAEMKEPELVRFIWKLGAELARFRKENTRLRSRIKKFKGNRRWTLKELE